MRKNYFIEVMCKGRAWSASPEGGRHESAVKRAGETPALRNARLGTLHGIAKHLWRAQHAAPLRMLGEIKNNEWATDQRPSPTRHSGREQRAHAPAHSYECLARR
jgi:hypothetical protein